MFSSIPLCTVSIPDWGRGMCAKAASACAVIPNQNGLGMGVILPPAEDHAISTMWTPSLERNSMVDNLTLSIFPLSAELVIPGTANVFYAMNSRVNFDFVLRKVKQRSRTSLTLPRNTKWGCWSNKNNKITLWKWASQHSLLYKFVIYCTYCINGFRLKYYCFI